MWGIGDRFFEESPCPLLLQEQKGPEHTSRAMRSHPSSSEYRKIFSSMNAFNLFVVLDTACAQCVLIHMHPGAACDLLNQLCRHRVVLRLDLRGIQHRLSGQRHLEGGQPQAHLQKGTFNCSGSCSSQSSLQGCKFTQCACHSLKFDLNVPHLVSVLPIYIFGHGQVCQLKAVFV